MAHIYAIVVTDEEELGFESFEGRVNDRLTTGSIGVNWLSNPLIPTDVSSEFQAIVLEHGDTLGALDDEGKQRTAGENLRAAVEDADRLHRSLRRNVGGTALLAGLDAALECWDGWAAQFKDRDGFPGPWR